MRMILVWSSLCLSQSHPKHNSCSNFWDNQKQFPSPIMVPVLQTIQKETLKDNLTLATVQDQIWGWRNEQPNWSGGPKLATKCVPPRPVSAATLSSMFQFPFPINCQYYDSMFKKDTSVF